MVADFDYSEEKGHSLLEVLAVIGVLSVVMFMAFPNFFAVRKLEVDVFAHQLAGQMRRMQQQAIGQNVYWEMRFRQNTPQYLAIYRRTQFIESIYLPPGLQWGCTAGGHRPPDLLRFNGLGTPNQGMTIAISDGDCEVRYVIVAPVLGRVRVSRTPPG